MQKLHSEASQANSLFRSVSLILEKSTGACSEGIFSKTGSRREIILSKNIPPRNYPETGGPRLQFCSGNCWGDAKTVYFAYIYIYIVGY